MCLFAVQQDENFVVNADKTLCELSEKQEFE